MVTVLKWDFTFMASGTGIYNGDRFNFDFSIFSKEGTTFNWWTVGVTVHTPSFICSSLLLEKSFDLGSGI